MKRTKNHLLILLLAGISLGARAQNSGPLASNENNGAAASAPAATTTSPAPATITAADVEALKDALAAQQRQIDRLTKALQLREAQSAATVDSNDAKPAPAQVAAATPATSAIVTSTPAAATSNPAAVAATQQTGGLDLQTEAGTAKDDNPMHGPISIHFRGITITPGGFAAAEFVRRSRALASDITTPFNSLTMPD
jgi:hypothetical protein